MQGSYLGPEFSNDEIKEQLDKVGAKYEFLSEQKLIDKAVKDLSHEEAIGWFQGRMEFGPRALGARSILADPRSESMQKKFKFEN